ncbi:putative transporter [Neisseria meningitidis]|nr:putative transporter [Neisseria meningitidis]
MENQRPLLGFALALLAAMTWGTLPIAVRQALKFVDAPTLVWVRFTVAAAVLFVLLALGGRLPKWREFFLVLIQAAAARRGGHFGKLCADCPRAALYFADHDAGFVADFAVYDDCCRCVGV